MSDKERAGLACHCGQPSTVTEFSPYMNDYCEDCTMARCDAFPGECPIAARLVRRGEQQ